jgi:undecaprenyl-diphosphatase
VISVLLRFLVAVTLGFGRGTWSLISTLGLVLALGLLAGGLTLVAFVALTSEVIERGTEQVDVAVYTWLQHWESQGLDGLAHAVSALGSEVLLAVLVILLSLFAIQRQWSAAGGLAVVTVGAAGLNTLLKQLIHRARPEALSGLIPAQAFSFPSGHAMTAAAVYGYLALLAWRRWQGGKRVLVVSSLGGLIALISLARLYLGVHYLTDVVAGCLAGFLWADAVALSAALLRRRGARAPHHLAPVGSERQQ